MYNITIEAENVQPRKSLEKNHFLLKKLLSLTKFFR